MHLIVISAVEALPRDDGKVGGETCNDVCYVIIWDAIFVRIIAPGIDVNDSLPVATYREVLRGNSEIELDLVHVICMIEVSVPKRLTIIVWILCP